MPTVIFKHQKCKHPSSHVLSNDVCGCCGTQEGYCESCDADVYRKKGEMEWKKKDARKSSWARFVKNFNQL